MPAAGTEHDVGSGLNFHGSEAVNLRLQQITGTTDFENLVGGVIGFYSANGDKHIGFYDDQISAMVKVPRMDFAESLTGQWTFAPGVVRAPFLLNSNAQGQMVTGLNSDMVDGWHASQSATASTVGVRNSDGTLTVADGNQAAHAATYGQLTAALNNRDQKASCRAATAAPLPSNTISNSVITASANGALPAQDGVTMVVGDRLLVSYEGGFNQVYLGSTDRRNGIYVVTDLGSVSTPWILTRAADADAGSEVTNGMTVFVAEGTQNLHSEWSLITFDPITLTTTGADGTALQFSLTNANTLYQAGNGIVLNGNKFHFAQASNYTQGGLAWANGTTTMAITNALSGILQANGSSAPTGVTAAAAGSVLPYYATTSTIGTTAQGAANTVLHGNAGSAPTWGAVSLTTDISGILPLANGGTGADLSGAGATGGLVYKASGTALTVTAALTGILKGNGGSAPTAVAGTANTVAKWGTNTLLDSSITDDGSVVTISDSTTRMVLAGQSTTVVQYQIGDSSAYGAIGTRYSSGSVIISSNAAQPTYNTDVWAKPLTNVTSLALDLLIGPTTNSTKFSFLRDPLVQANATYSSFWTEIASIDYTGMLTLSSGITLTGANTITTSTGQLDIKTGGWNSNIVLTPNGTGLVGVGQANPGVMLHVTGALGSDGLQAIAAFGGLKRVLIGYDTTNDYGFVASVQTGVSWRPLILQPTSGNVGIGQTTAPQQTLTLGSGSNFAVEMAKPTGVGAALATGGTLTVGTAYYYVITSLDGVGQTIQSAEVNASPTSGNQKISLTWTAVTGAASYDIYRSTTSGSYGATSFLASSATNSYTDDGSVALTSGTPPTVTTAYVNKISASGNSWIYGGDLKLSPVAAGNRYILLNGTSTLTGVLIMQAGGGSSGFGGALNLFSHSHASKPGWVTAGISSGSGGKFSVNTQGLAGGTDVLTVDANGLVLPGTDATQDLGASATRWAVGYFNQGKFSASIGIGAAPQSTVELTITQPVRTSGIPTSILWTGGAHTTLTAAETIDVNFNAARTVQFAGSASPGAANIATQRAIVFQAPTYAFSSTGAQTITDAATVAITGAPSAGTNATLTNAWALMVQGGASKFSGNVTITGTLTAGTYTGQSSIVTLGTITTGVWNGTTIAIANGGTGATTAVGAFNALSPLTTRGDILTRDATNNVRVAIGGSGNYLRSNGTDPAWSAILAADLPSSFSGLANPTASVGLTAVNGTATTAMRSDAAPALSQAIAPTWTALHTFNPGTTQSNVVLLDIAQPGSAGTRSGHMVEMRGTSYDTSGHTSAWRYYVNVTSNAGASSFLLQTRIDAASWANALEVTSGGILKIAGFNITYAYTTTLSTSATSYAITHNLNSTRLQVVLKNRTTGATGGTTGCVITDANNATVYFAVAPSANLYDLTLIALP